MAPITRGNTTLASYDFWAVGKDCCHSSTADFKCGDFDANDKVKGGLRAISEHDRAFYALAVKQAEALYHIKAVSPLFFHRVKDGPDMVQSWKDAGTRFFVVSLVSHCLLQFILAITAAVAFTHL